VRQSQTHFHSSHCPNPRALESLGLPFPRWGVMTKVTRDSNFFYILTHGESYKSMSFVSPTPPPSRLFGIAQISLGLFYGLPDDLRRNPERIWQRLDKSRLSIKSRPRRGVPGVLAPWLHSRMSSVALNPSSLRRVSISAAAKTPRFHPQVTELFSLRGRSSGLRGSR